MESESKKAAEEYERLNERLAEVGTDEEKLKALYREEIEKSQKQLTELYLERERNESNLEKEVIYIF